MLRIRKFGKQIDLSAVMRNGLNRTVSWYISKNFRMYATVEEPPTPLIRSNLGRSDKILIR